MELKKKQVLCKVCIKADTKHLLFSMVSIIKTEDFV